jgi:Fe2+ transport system protein FeoA
VSDANANSSHLLLALCNRILRAVKSTLLASEPLTASHVLAELRRGDTAIVSGLFDAAEMDAGRGAGESLIARLRDLGFVPGARCEVVARMWLGGDPMAVRIGGSTFALRRAEAAAVRVQLTCAAKPVRQKLAPEGTSAAAA